MALTTLAPPPAAIPAVPFWFLRHGETDWNVAHRIQGHTNTPLNATGLAQAEAVAQQLKPMGIARIISSPLQRAADTAAAVQRVLQIPLEHDERLKERYFGAFEGRDRHEILAQHNRPSDALYYDLLPPDSETSAMLQARIAAALSTHLSAHAAHPLLFVGHGAYMAHLCELLGLNSRLRFANALPYHFQPSPTGWAMVPHQPLSTF